MKAEKIWISWDQHRRSRELAGAFRAKLHVTEYAGNPLLRYAVLSVRTLFELLKASPKVTFCQNPSIVLATLLCLLRPVLGYRLVVDRHSNFKLNTVSNKSVKWRLFHLLSRYTTRHADITIVTNEYLRKLVDSWGGRGHVLQDKLPVLDQGGMEKLQGEQNIVFISTFSNDEPIAEVISAARLLPSNWVIYITGKYDERKLTQHNANDLPENVKLTGYLPESRYQSLLRSSDAIVVLTTSEYTLTCGAYEGLSILKPMVLSATSTIQEYFSNGSVYTKPNRMDIAEAIRNVIATKDQLRIELAHLKKNLAEDWDARFTMLIGIIQTL